ncbi:cytochrome P450 [Phlegmacium glaucopus]|nr:cytochrome P450 [Phlegmacium glaucopus]
MSRYTGNVTFDNVLAQPSQWGASTSLIATLIALTIAILSVVLRSSSGDKIHNLGGFHLLAAQWTFFSKRYDFFREHFKKTGANIFCFRLLRHRVIAVAGEANRKIFFNDWSLDVGEGYLYLLGGIPNLEDIDVTMDGPRDAAEFIKRLLLLLQKERVSEVLPLLLEDINRRMMEWGTEGKLNPFNEVYDLVFQMTVRMATCRELSDDREAVSRVAKHYWDIEKSATPVSVLLPWFPSSARKAKQNATMALYNMLLSYVNVRRKASTPSMDPIDFFISQGISDDTIVGTIMGIIFAGVINTGVNSSWALLQLGTNPKWKGKAIDEYKALVQKYTNTTSSDPLHTRLATIPLDAWEDELPSLDIIIRETLRITGSFTAFRRNLGKDIQMAGKEIIKRGDFLAYSTADTNLNPDIYTNPMTFDPDRYGPGREEDRKETYGYLAWGAGRHPCAGMKFAKLMIKLNLAMILLGYEYELVDSNGSYPKALPQQDRNDLQQSRPIGEPCYLKYKRILE